MITYMLLYTQVADLRDIGHNSNLLVEKGDTVKVGDDIAESGNTGKSSGPHLHYGVSVSEYKPSVGEFYTKDKSIDPALLSSLLKIDKKISNNKTANVKKESVNKTSKSKDNLWNEVVSEISDAINKFYNIKF